MPDLSMAGPTGSMNNYTGRREYTSCHALYHFSLTLLLLVRTMSEPVHLSTGDLALLTNELKEVIDPHILGIKLGIESSTVAQILQDVGNTTERQKSGILDHWLKNDSNASWPTLVKALKEMDHKRLAEGLEKTYCSQEAQGI